MSNPRLSAILSGLKPGTSAYVDAKSLGVSTQGFHAIVSTWAKNNGGPGFEVAGDPHKSASTGLYDKVRLRRRAPNPDRAASGGGAAERHKG